MAGGDASSVVRFLWQDPRSFLLAWLWEKTCMPMNDPLFSLGPAEASRAVARFYDRFAVFYPCVDWFLARPRRTLGRCIEQCPAGDLLEIGVGTGSNLKHYRRHRATGVDVSARMLARAQARNRDHRVALRGMDGHTLQFEDQCFDWVVISHVIAVATQPAQLLAEAARVLRPQGRLFVLNHFTPDHALGRLDRWADRFSGWLHFRAFFPLASLQRLLPSGLVIEQVLDAGLHTRLVVLSRRLES
jgi:phosphatidylethanolamine/phosphatidyl-N-methylethanolamine N-methyltransferase